MSLSLTILASELEEIPEQPDGADSAMQVANAMESFLSIGHHFTTVLQLLWTYTHGVGVVADRTSLMNLASITVLLKSLKERETNAAESDRPLAEVTLTLRAASGDEDDREIVKSCRVYDRDHLSKVADCIRYHDAALSILNDTVLQQVVNAWESCLGALVNWHLANSSDSVGNSEVISIAQVLKFESFDDVKKYLIDQQVTEFLKRKDTLEQLSYIKDKLGADLSTHFEKKKTLLR